jgi:glutathione S-transferase
VCCTQLKLYVTHYYRGYLGAILGLPLHYSNLDTRPLRAPQLLKSTQFLKMTDSNPLVLYDISSPIQPRSYAPNPSKARLALSFKNVPFKSTFIDIPDIPEVRKGLKCPATRKLDDGSDYYTLPMLHDPSSDKIIGDSFDMANYLEDNFPASGGCLFPKDSTGTGLDYESPNKDTMFFAPITTNEGSKNETYAKFNLHVDATFSANVILVAQYMPFNPESAEATKALFVKRAHLNAWEDLSVQGEAREQVRAGFKEALKSLAELFMVHESGPYLEGKEANYADLIVGGWVNMMSETMPKEEWEQFRSWHGGVFARLHDALQEKYYVCK